MGVHVGFEKVIWRWSAGWSAGWSDGATAGAHAEACWPKLLLYSHPAWWHHCIWNTAQIKHPQQTIAACWPHKLTSPHRQCVIASAPSPLCSLLPPPCFNLHSIPPPPDFSLGPKKSSKTHLTQVSGLG